MNLKLDIGCGPNPKEGFTGLDRKKYNENTKIVFDIDTGPLPFEDGSVDEIYCSHVLEHLFYPISVVGEFYRVLKLGGKCTIKVPYFRHPAANIPTHRNPWSFSAEMVFNGAYHECPNAFSKVTAKGNFTGDNPIVKLFQFPFKLIMQKSNAVYDKYFGIFMPIYEIEWNLVK